jgi:hypothetical protein
MLFERTQTMENVQNNSHVYTYTTSSEKFTFTEITLKIEASEIIILLSAFFITYSFCCQAATEDHVHKGQSSKRKNQHFSKIARSTYNPKPQNNN